MSCFCVQIHRTLKIRHLKTKKKLIFTRFYSFRISGLGFLNLSNLRTRFTGYFPILLLTNQDEVLIKLAIVTLKKPRANELNKITLIDKLKKSIFENVNLILKHRSYL